MIVGSRSAVPDDIKADIARSLPRSVDASATSRLRPRKPHFCVGGVLYRAGPPRSATRWRFVGRENAGPRFTGNRPGFGMILGTVSSRGNSFETLRDQIDGLVRHW